MKYEDREYYAEEMVPRKRRRKKHYFLRFLVFAAIIAAAYFILTSQLFAIATINVKGNTHYTKEQIEKISGISAGDNIFQTRMSKAEKALNADPYIKSAEIKRKMPRAVTITVKERMEGFCVSADKKYATLDGDGMVVAISEHQPNVTLVDGLGVTSAKEGSKAGVEKNMQLSDTAKFIDTVRTNGLYFKRIDASEVTVKAYLNDELVCEGTYAMLEKDISELKLVISDLQKRGVKKGTIIVNGSGSCTFTPKV